MSRTRIVLAVIGLVILFAVAIALNIANVKWLRS